MCSVCDVRFKVRASSEAHKKKFHDGTAKIRVDGGNELKILRAKLCKQIEPEVIVQKKKTFKRYDHLPIIKSSDLREEWKLLKGDWNEQAFGDE